LFPAPIRPGDTSENASRVLDLFKTLGCFVAKALLDNRLLDLPFSLPCYKWMLGKDITAADLKFIDPEFGASFEKMMDLCKEKKAIETDSSMNPDDCKIKIENLKLGNCAIKDLDLDFTLPGRSDWELKPNGSNISVTIENLEEYLNLLAQQHLVNGVAAQLENFRKGFNEVFQMENLSAFSEDELESLICGVEESYWDMQTLLDNTKCDHGYSHDSPTVRYLLEILTELSPSEQKQFLLFVTGSPKLPVGGFKSMNPKLTIVRKDLSGNSSLDNYLPSVNCCFYYLKLPEYTSKQVLKEKLMFAIENGQGSFSFN